MIADSSGFASFLRRATRWSLVVLVIGAVVAAGCANARTSKATSTAISPSGTVAFGASGYDGGGFVNVVAADPTGSGLVLAGGDVSGVHRSTDWGQTWSPSNRGITIGQLAVAAFAFSSAHPGTVYAALGSGGPGGVEVSTDGGQTWTVTSTQPRFNGYMTNRITGRLLAVDDANSLLYAATFDQGVLRSGDGGKTWTALGLAGVTLRGLAFDPSQPDTLFVAGDGGIYKTSSARGSGGFTAVTSGPASAEELAIGGGSVFAAAGVNGMWRSQDGGATWAKLTNGPLGTDGPAWLAVETTTVAGATVVYAGNANPNRNGTTSDSIIRSADGGSTWASVTADAGAISVQVAGSGGTDWWQPTGNLLGRGAYISNSLAVAGSRVLSAGRAGIWGSTDGAATWHPFVKGMGLTVNHGVVADPNVAGRVFVTTGDWVLMGSKDSMGHVSMLSTPSGSVGFGLALDTSTSPSTVVLAAGSNLANTGGGIYTSADPFSGQWTDEGFGAAVGGKRALAVATQTVNGDRVIIAAVDQGGIWRKAGGVWTQVSTTAMTAVQKSKGASVVWPAGSATAYLYDRQTGVWRSNDRGATWSLMWQKPSAIQSTGFVDTAPGDPTRLYVSVGVDGVYRIDKATTGTVGAGLTAVRLSGPASPGALTVKASGTLYVAGAAYGSPPSLMRSTDAGATWSKVDDTFYDSAADFPEAMAVANDGHIYSALLGDGVIVGTGG